MPEQEGNLQGRRSERLLLGRGEGSWSEPRAAGPLDENIARIESLKIKLLQLPGLGERTRNEIFRDLDALRSALVHNTNRFKINVADGGDRLPQATVAAPRDELKIEGIIGQSQRLQKILKIISKIAATDLTVLMEGETGSGKELFARIIHNNSDRAHFVAVNCGAFPSGLIESELFGHIKGAFTGATHERKGKFEEANGGTIFLDEIGELEMSAQVKLLRVLQEGELQRVGSDSTIKTNVRVIAATNRDLSEMVRAQTFREDLYYRINMCPLFIPPLRERRDEIKILLEYFFQQVCDAMGAQIPLLDRELAEFLYEKYDFPGNIRELKNIAHYLAHIAGARALRVDDLPERYSLLAQTLAPDDVASEASQLERARDAAEREFLVAALERHHGSIGEVCAEVGLSRSRLYQLLKKYQIMPAAFRSAR